MTLVQVIIFIASIAGIIYFIRLWVVDLGFPGSLINAIKPHECEFCGKKYWTNREAFECCKGTPGYEARARRIAKYKASKGTPKKETRSPIGMTTEHDCPRCNGKPGDYACPLCDGRGKTFIW